MGWTSKPPPARGIETRWKYILPGRNASGVEAVDYVLGEQAVVNYADMGEYFVYCFINRC
ncbi:hypothetical protein PHMEG_00035352 [Phytophthora megakarya]|uniref:Uncharacterized protein n=1 Tax=Phytophthora megakarya TaxID=4795 RepID=A0A225UNX3_9STRA|nr:hypothetical protein PHMEG_00035352 [Phytophthora megakarya]